MNKLYEVNKKYYVMAEHDFEAEFVDVSLCEPTVEVFEAESVDHDWWDSIPAGGDDDRTCGQILESQRQLES